MHTSKSSYLDSNIEKWTALAIYKLNTAFWTQKLPHCSSRGWSLHISPGHLENPAHILRWKCGSYGMLWPSQVSRLSAIQRCGRFCIPLRPLAVRPRLIEWKIRKGAHDFDLWTIFRSFVEQRFDSNHWLRWKSICPAAGRPEDSKIDTLPAQFICTAAQFICKAV